MGEALITRRGNFLGLEGLQCATSLISSNTAMAQQYTYSLPDGLTTNDIKYYVFYVLDTGSAYMYAFAIYNAKGKRIISQLSRDGLEFAETITFENNKVINESFGYTNRIMCALY